jgi:signal transduction histidine kinase
MNGKKLFDRPSFTPNVSFRLLKHGFKDHAAKHAMFLSLFFAALVADMIELQFSSADLLLLNIPGLMFVCAAIFYRGDFKLWWLIAAPIGVAASITPLYSLSDQEIGLGGLILAFGVPTLLSIIAGAIGVLKETQGRSQLAYSEIRRVVERSAVLMNDLRRTERELTEILQPPEFRFHQDPIQDSKLQDSKLQDSKQLLWQKLPLSLQQGPLQIYQQNGEYQNGEYRTVAHCSDNGYYDDSKKILDLITVHEALNNAVTEIKFLLGRQEKSEQELFKRKYRFNRHLTATTIKNLTPKVSIVASDRITDLKNQAWSVGKMKAFIFFRGGDTRDLMIIYRALMIHAIRSMGKGGNTLRVNWQLKVNSLELKIEDNGRGFNEQIIERLEGSTHESDSFWETVLVGQQGLRTFQDIRSWVQRKGGTLELKARLGVGSQTILEFPLVPITHQQQPSPHHQSQLHQFSSGMPAAMGGLLSPA